MNETNEQAGAPNPGNQSEAALSQSQGAMGESKAGNGEKVGAQPPLDPLTPVQRSERFEMLDVLRGFAILGILMPNIQTFSMISVAYSNPLAYGNFEGANFFVWLATQMLFEQKFMTLFSMMFGAGILLMSQRAEQKGQTGLWKVHYRRMAWMLLFGLLHAHIFWYGDILFTYAVGGCVVYWLRRLPPVWLTAIGIVMNAVGSLAIVGIGLLVINLVPEDALEEMRKAWLPPQELVQQEVDAYRGGWLSQAAYRSLLSLQIQLMMVPMMLFWRTAGLMLIGMALFKWGFITGQAKTRNYLIAIAVAIMVAWPAIGAELAHSYSTQWEFPNSQFFGTQVNYWVAPLVSLAYMSIIALICRFGVLGILANALKSVGQMAFTNYLMQTVICTTIFYGHGFGWYGHLERIEQFGVVLAVWAFQLVVSPIWMSQFRYGPAEWVWRSLTYWKRQPFLRD